MGFDIIEINLVFYYFPQYCGLGKLIGNLPAWFPISTVSHLLQQSIRRYMSRIFQKIFDRGKCHMDGKRQNCGWKINFSMGGWVGGWLVGWVGLLEKWIKRLRSASAGFELGVWLSLAMVWIPVQESFWHPHTTHCWGWAGSRDCIRER